uniref:Cytochrome P450 n=1 Tax=Leersia perrieri TaxID=77586 RepID=A0A0D9WIM8_9ORYZ
MACEVQLGYANMLVCLLFLASCLLAAVWTFRSSDGGGGVKQIPSPPALPFIGNLHQLGKGRLHRTLHDLARRHGGGELLRLRLGPSSALVVVSSAPTAEAVLRHQDHVFCGRPQQRTAMGALYGCRDVAFSPYGERWRRLRRVAASRLLAPRRVDSFRALREHEVASLLLRVAHDAARGGDGVDVSALVVRMTNAVVSRAAFGRRLGGVDAGEARETIAELADLLETIAASDVFPWLGRVVDWATGLDARTKRTARKLDEVLEMALRDHERSRGDDGDGEARDFMDDLLSIVNDDDGGGEHGYKLDRIDVKGLILDMFIAGTDTIYKTIEWTMAELIKNPAEMAKVQAEVRHVARAQGNTGEGDDAIFVKEDQLGKMTLLRAAIKEAMRLHPPVPLLVPRESIQDTVLHGYHVPAGTRVMINAWAIGRDAATWENAGEFRPERFVHGDAAGVEYYGGKDCHDFRFIPFGAGRRGCPGVAFGTRLVEFALANMVCRFDWELPDGQDLESFEVVESTGLSPGLVNPLVLVAKPL